jgi:hypothetical protein
MNSTQYNIVANTENHNANQKKLFQSRRDAESHGYFSRSALARRYCKPISSEPDAELVTKTRVLEADDPIRGWNLGVEFLDDNSMVMESLNLFHVSNTKPYKPTPKTEALWSLSDLFITSCDHYAEKFGNHWRTVNANDKQDWLTASSLNPHLRGEKVFGVFATRRTRFVAAVVSMHQAKAVLENAENIKTAMYASKWFWQRDGNNVHVIWTFDGLQKTVQAKAKLHAHLKALKVFEEVYPQNKKPYPLPLSGNVTVILDKPLGMIDGKSGPEQDVASFGEWLQLTDLDGQAVELTTLLKSNMTCSQRQPGNALPKGRERYQDIDLLSITMQTENVAHGKLKNRCWKTLTDHWLGHSNFSLNRAITITARIFFVEGVSRDDAIQILDAWCDEIPNPTSSRLTDSSKRYVLTRDIERMVAKIYDCNGGQADPKLSDTKLHASVKCWNSKGLILSDKSTWDLTYGYVAMPDVEFTQEELKNIEVYLLPLLSGRDTKGREPAEVAIQLAQAVVKLVAAKEKEGKELATNYFKKYIKGETGVSCHERKWPKIKEALIDLGFIKVLRQGRKGAGATRYGLTGRMAEILCRDGVEATSEEIVLPSDLDRKIEETVEGWEVQYIDLLSITMQKDSQSSIPPISASQLINEWQPTGDSIFDQLLAKQPKQYDPELIQRRRCAIC